jgi:putative endonuclease
VFYTSFKYVLHGEKKPDERYVGFTTDLKARLKTHHSGGSAYTAEYKPWKVVGYHAFANGREARELESELKSGSGRAFANKRLW